MTHAKRKSANGVMCFRQALERFPYLWAIRSHWSNGNTQITRKEISSKMLNRKMWLVRFDEMWVCIKSAHRLKMLHFDCFVVDTIAQNALVRADLRHCTVEAIIFATVPKKNKRTGNNFSHENKRARITIFSSNRKGKVHRLCEKVAEENKDNSVLSHIRHKLKSEGGTLQSSHV